MNTGHYTSLELHHAKYHIEQPIECIRRVCICDQVVTNE